MTEPANAPGLPSVRCRHPARDIVELVLSVLVLYLVIRQFGCEIFKIPTGSMAPTLLGQHRDLHCPNCGLEFPMDAGEDETGTPKVTDAVCPNCGYEFPRDEVESTFCTCFPAPPRWLVPGGHKRRLLSDPAPRPWLFERGDNRVIVDKFMWDFSADPIARAFYRKPLARTFSAPKRWDIIVFRVPMADITCRKCGNRIAHVRVDGREMRCPRCDSADLQFERQTYIKRLIGLPGETIKIFHGDIYVNGKIACPPPEVQDSLWQFVYDSARVPQKSYWLDPTWRRVEGDFKDEAGILRLVPGDSRTAEVRYGRRILDNSIYSNRTGENPNRVGDLKVDVQAKLDGTGVLRLKITEDDLTCIGAVRFGPASTKTGIRTSAVGAVPMESDFTADPAKVHRVIFTNGGDRYQLTVDGRVVLSCDRPMPTAPEAEQSSVAIQVESARAELSHVRLGRDIYYLPPEAGGWYAKDINGRDLYGPKNIFDVPDNEYFALGDNVRSSLDSRYWGAIPEANLIGRASVVWWPPSILRAIY